MKAIIINTEDKNRPLLWDEVPTPSYGDDEVLVDIYATALNRADLLQRAGGYAPPPGAPDTLGLEMAGKIAAVGADVSNWEVGQRVCALLTGGGYAEQVAVPHQLLMPIPDMWDFNQAAAVPEVFYTAYVNLFMEAGLNEGETVLIHGGASGVGTAAIQMAHQAGCKVLTTAGTPEKVARCLALGADLAINYKEADFAKEIEADLGEQAVDVILDIVGASYFEQNLQLLKLKGRWVFVGLLGGPQATVNLRDLMRRRLRLIGSVLRSRTIAEKTEIKERFMAQFWPLLRDGTIKPIIDSVYPIQQANEAQQRMKENKNIGKIILQVKV